MSDSPEFQSQVLASFAALNDRIAGLDTKIDALRTRQEQMGFELNNRISRLQDSITTLREDMQYGVNAADHTARNLENTRQETRLLSENQSILYRKLNSMDDRLRSLEDKQ
jgi:chromosome segregation ATPase